MLAVSYEDLAADSRAFVDRLGVTYPVALDPDGEASRVRTASPIPQTFFVDADGVLRDRVYGITSKPALDEPLDAAERAGSQGPALLPAERARRKRSGDRPGDQHDEPPGGTASDVNVARRFPRECGGREQLGDRLLPPGSFQRIRHA